jgi:predicted nuclease of predicted toxin-antitoxin system
VIFWVDAQLPPSLAPWLTERFGVKAQSMRFLGLQAAEDADIFERARAAGDIVSGDWRCLTFTYQFEAELAGHLLQKQS